jgi:hypothetical protein
MTRELTGHKVNGCNDALRIGVLDEPGHGGACHHYQIINNDAPATETAGPGEILADFTFQNGPIKEVGTNGITHESLLEILIDRLRGFQSGPYKCQENLGALNHLLYAQAVLKSRTEARLARGVEGTHTV